MNAEQAKIVERVIVKKSKFGFKNQVFYLVAKTYKFKNHHNGASRSKTVLVKRSLPLLRGEQGYRSSDDFQPNDFGNGFTEVEERFASAAEYLAHLDVPEEQRHLFHAVNWHNIRPLEEIPVDEIVETKQERYTRELQETLAKNPIVLDFED